MFIEDFETDIVNRLVARIGTVIDIEKLPEKQSDFSTPFSKAKVSVVYKSSDYDTPKSTSHTAQQENAQAELVIQARNLRGTNGLYDVYDKCRKALIGFIPRNCGRIYAVSFKFEERNEAIWTYIFTIAARSEFVIDNDEVVDPSISQIKANSPGYPIIVVP